MLPDPLDTVFLVNSGSEASDLALRLAMAATGRRDVVAVREAYHGWTYATDAVSTSTADNPNALATRPDWVHTVESPNSFRGKFRGADADRYAAEAVAPDRGPGRRRAGRPPRSSAEPVYGNAGGMALPDGYLEQVYAAVRAGGGLAIADEVQVAYGRLGNWFWGFQQQNVVPDIVSVAKSTGNGYPLGAVITSRDDRRQVLQPGLLLLVHRRQPAVVRDRHDGARRAARRRTAGERRTGRRASEGETASAAGQAPDHRHRARHRAVPGRRDGPRPGHPRTRPSRRPRRSATACSNSVWSSSRPATT